MNAPRPFPSAYRTRYLPAMTLAQIHALPDRDRAPVIVTTGAIEQHGPHLPVAVDAFLGQLWLSLALARLPAEAQCYVAPAIVVGKSNEHVGFPGTLSISKETLRELLLAIGAQVRAWGFRQLLVLNTHGGNSAVIRTVLPEIRALHGIEASMIRPRVDFGQNAQETTWGFHAGELETSWMLAAAKEWVRQELAVCEYPARVDAPGELRPEAAPATFAWATRDLSKSGVMGDATAASEEKGRRWIELQADACAQQIVEACARLRTNSSSHV